VNSMLRVLALTTLLAACASAPLPPPEPAPPLQDRLEAQNRAARTAFEKGRFQQAADLYAQALGTATAMDDSPAIVDAHYNRAVSMMLSENYAEARLSVARAEGELSRSGRTQPPELTLLAATLAYRTGEDDIAWDLTASLIGAGGAGNTQITERTWFIRGLLAKRREDRAMLDTAITALGGSLDADTQADRLELEGYRAAADGNLEAAIAALDAASLHRNEVGDYRGKSRSLVAAAEVLEVMGRKREAANRFLRAGRSAALRGSLGEARTRLKRAEDLAIEADAPGIADEARRQLEAIGEES